MPRFMYGLAQLTDLQLYLSTTNDVRIFIILFSPFQRFQQRIQTRCLPYPQPVFCSLHLQALGEKPSLPGDLCHRNVSHLLD